MSRWKIVLIVLGVLVVVVVAFYAISPLFRNVRANDSLPADGSRATASETAAARVTGTLGHPASGTARILHDGPSMYLRYENFHTINGPDIFVYLSTDKEASDFVSLGVVKATDGNINYEIPAGTDLSKYHYALTWCRTFHVLFNWSDLSTSG